MRAIRNNLESELANETARRLAITDAGNPPPTNYSAGGKSVSWDGYVSMMVEKIEKLNALILNMGGDEGGIPETVVHMW
jgi:hypothetical protein